MGQVRGGALGYAPAPSALQVLVSIQSLILVEQPFYNEPGYEQRANQARSDAYSAEVMENAVRWGILDQLRSPPEYFADAIRAHFRERGVAVAGTAGRWAQWCRSKGHHKQADAISKMLPEVEAEIAKLQAG